jgi:hypothetical protein
MLQSLEGLFIITTELFKLTYRSRAMQNRLLFFLPKSLQETQREASIPSTALFILRQL